MTAYKKIVAGMAGALLLTGVLSCQNQDVCDGVAGSCLALRVEGDGPFDSLRTTLNLIGDVGQQRIGDTSGDGGGVELPMTLRVVPPADVASSAVLGVSVTGLRQGIDAASASTEPGFSWPEGSHLMRTLQLQAAEIVDGGSVNDQSMPPGTDMSMPPQDMSGPPPDLKWRTEPSSAMAVLLGVWAASATRAYAVGDNGTILSRQTDSSWRAEASGTTATLNGVTGLLTGSAWTVGQRPGAWRRDAMNWSQDVTGLTLATNGELFAVAPGATAGELWAGDRDGRVWHRTGSANGAGTWLTPDQVFMAGERVMGVASAGGVVFAVGDNGRVAMRPNSMPGTSWQPFQYGTLPNGDVFTIASVWAFDKSTAVAVGTDGFLVRYSGGTWQPTPTQIDAKGDFLTGVWGQRSDRIWVVGFGGVIFRVEGARSTELLRTSLQNLNAVYGLSETDIYIVGEKSGASLILHGTP